MLILTRAPIVQFFTRLFWRKIELVRGVELERFPAGSPIPRGTNWRARWVALAAAYCGTLPVVHSRTLDRRAQRLRNDHDSTNPEAIPMQQWSRTRRVALAAVYCSTLPGVRSHALNRRAQRGWIDHNPTNPEAAGTLAEQWSDRSRVLKSQAHGNYARTRSRNKAAILRGHTAGVRRQAGVYN